MSQLPSWNVLPRETQYSTPVFKTKLIVAFQTCRHCLCYLLCFFNALLSLYPASLETQCAELTIQVSFYCVFTSIAVRALVSVGNVQASRVRFELLMLPTSLQKWFWPAASHHYNCLFTWTFSPALFDDAPKTRFGVNLLQSPIK